MRLINAVEMFDELTFCSLSEPTPLLPEKNDGYAGSVGQLGERIIHLGMFCLILDEKKAESSSCVILFSSAHCSQVRQLYAAS